MAPHTQHTRSGPLKARNLRNRESQHGQATALPRITNLIVEETTDESLKSRRSWRADLLTATAYLEGRYLDWSQMYIDLHSHLLPGIDDGPRTIDGSIALAEGFLQVGIGRVVATPHINGRWGYPGQETLRTAFDSLTTGLDDAGLDLKLELGGEVALTIVEDLGEEQLSGLKLAGGDWLLIEPPSSGPSVSVHAMLFDLQSRGHRILLAHPERCRTFQDDLELLSSLVEGGMRTQVTATATTGRFGSAAAKCARSMFDRGLVHVVASDAHHATERPPGMAGELKQAGHEDLIQYLCHDMPAWILDGGEEPARPEGRGKKKAGRGILGRLGFNS